MLFPLKFLLNWLYLSALFSASLVASSQIEVVLDAREPSSPTPESRTESAPNSLSTKEVPEDSVPLGNSATTPFSPAEHYRISGMTLNEFVQVMAQKAGLSYVRNPLIDSPKDAVLPGHPAPSGPPMVEGTFTSTDPLSMVRAAARAHGYRVIIHEGVLELQNSETEKSLPLETYTYTFRYLRIPRYTLTQDNGSVEESSTGTSGPSGNTLGSASSSGNTTNATSNFGSNLESSEKKMIDFFKGLLSADAYLNFNSKTNTLVARDIDANIALLDAMIRRLDIEKPNVLTAVTALEVEANPQTQFGFDWSSLGGTGTSLQVDALNTLGQIFFPGQNILGFGSSKTVTAQQTTEPGSRYAAVVTPSTISTVVRALQAKGLAEIRARFFVCTEDNEAGRTRVTSDFPILKSYTANSGSTTGTGGQPTPVLDNANVGNTLEVVPQLLPNNMVRLQIKPIIRSLGDQRSIDLGQPVGTVKVDVIENRTTDVTVRVPLNHSLVLGGLNQVFFTDSSNKVPLLGDIPVLNFFFSSKNYQRQTRNLVLIVEPSILDPNDTTYLDQLSKEAREKMNDHTQQTYLPLDGKKIDRS